MNKANSTQTDVSVVICAYADERWECLLRAVDSVYAQAAQPREVIVVIDHNPRLLERVRAQLPKVVASENKGPKGLSGGRNTGIALAQGEAIAFLDDDAEAAADWLERLTFWFASKDVVGVGGAVEPNWESKSPAWFPKEFGWVVGCSYRGLPEQSARVRNLFGGCMCVRREAFDVAGGFRSSIGRGTGQPMGCEETEFCIRAQQKRPEWRFVYEPGARIYHQVPTNRATFAYFLKRCYAEGLSKAQVSQLVGAGDALSTERSYTLETLPSGVWRGLVDTFWQRDLVGVLRSAAIVAGLTYTSVGYGVGSLKPTHAVAEGSLGLGQAP